MWSVAARRPRRLRLVAKAPPLAKSVAARSSDALRSAAAASSAVGASVPRSEVGFTVVLRASGASGVTASSLATALSELSPAAARVAVGCAVVGTVVEAGLELVSAIFAVGRTISGNEPTFSGFEASSVFLVSAGATLFSVAASVAVASAFSIAEAGVSEVAAAVPERSIFGTDPPSPYALEATGASA